MNHKTCRELDQYVDPKPRPQVQPAAILRCPACTSSRIEVVKTSRTALEEIIRRKHCLICGCRWYTIQPPEREIPDYDVQWPPRSQRNKVRIKYLPTAHAPTNT